MDGDILFGLLKKMAPRVHKHIKKQKMEPILYMTEWFLCVFTRSLPWATVLRIWDMFLCEGTRIHLPRMCYEWNRNIVGYVYDCLRPNKGLNLIAGTTILVFLPL